MPVRASALVTGGMIALPVAVALACAFAYASAWAAAEGGRFRGAALGRAVLVLAGWMAATAAIAATGVLFRFDVRPPPLAATVVASLLGAVVVATSRVGRRLADGLPLAALVGLQSFRLPLELVMHRAAQEGTMPVQMTFGGGSGRNFDVLTGLGALVVAGLLLVGRVPRAVVWVWNIAGLALLARIMAIAIASLPPVHAFGSDAAHLNTWVCAFPFIWLPALLVPVALAGHIVITRRLLRERRRA
jgi:hypothetical protein